MVKQFLTKPPVLVPPGNSLSGNTETSRRRSSVEETVGTHAPRPVMCNGESLLLYISATTQVVSSALVVEREEEGHAFRVQRPMYFISEVLSNSKTRYPQI